MESSESEDRREGEGLECMLVGGRGEGHGSEEGGSSRGPKESFEETFSGDRE